VGRGNHLEQSCDDDDDYDYSVHFRVFANDIGLQQANTKIYSKHKEVQKIK
jgi:hypothetical protein